ncbi:MAG: hypothetical protein RL200_516 [Actinomycetota bacterium]
MAEPVSRTAWSRLVALLNAYVSEGGTAFSNAGPLWKAENWTVEQSGLNISNEWSFPDRISRAMVKSMFEWSKHADEMYRAFCATMMWAGERVANAPYVVRHVASQSGLDLGEEVLKLKTDTSFEKFVASPLGGLGPVLGTSLLNAVSTDDSRVATIDQYSVDWMWEYGQVSESWMLDLSNFGAEDHARYSAWCKQALDRFRESGHLPDHCDDHAFIGYLMSTDRVHSLLGIRFSGWVQAADMFASGSAKK